MTVDPARFTPLNLTSDFAKYFYRAADFVEKNMRFYSQPDKDSYVDFIRSFGVALENDRGDKSSRKDFFEWISKFDSFQGTSFLETFPEYKEFWELCRRS